MAKLALVYGMRLFPEDELGEISEATVTLKDGRTSRVTMHLIEGSSMEGRKKGRGSEFKALTGAKKKERY